MEGGSECSGRPIFFLLKKIGFAPWPDIMLSQTLTRNLPIESGVRQQSYPLMIPLNSFLAKWNNRTWRDVTIWMWRDLVLLGFFYYFDFVHSNARCACCSIVCWREWGSSFKIGRPKSKGGKMLDVDRQRGGRSWKLDNFYGRHMCIVPNFCKFNLCLNSNEM